MIDWGAVHRAYDNADNATRLEHLARLREIDRLAEDVRRLDKIIKKRA